MGADIHRHLAGEPVEAGPPSATYRLRKLIKRNKVVVFAGVSLVACLAAGVAATSLALLREHEARQEALLSARRANSSREQAEDILRYLLGTLRNRLKTTAALGVMRDVEDQVEQYYDRLGVDERGSHQMHRRAGYCATA